jgi:hypothetical protein
MPAIICPNKNDPAWKRLVEAIGEDRSYLAFFRNGNVIPDVATGRAKLGIKQTALARSPERPLSKSKKQKATVPKSIIELRPVVAPKIKAGKFAKPCRQVNFRGGRLGSHPGRQLQARHAFITPSAKVSI